MCDPRFAMKHSKSGFEHEFDIPANSGLFQSDIGIKIQSWSGETYTLGVELYRVVTNCGYQSGQNVRKLSNGYCRIDAMMAECVEIQDCNLEKITDLHEITAIRHAEHEYALQRVDFLDETSMMLGYMAWNPSKD